MMKLMKILLTSLIGGVAVTLSTACQSPSPQLLEQKLRTNIVGEPATLDPRKGGDSISSAMQFILFEGLTRLNIDGSTSPAQASSIEVSEDRKTYTFYLRGTEWTNGMPVTAHDFEKAWKSILDPAFPSLNAHLFYCIENAEKAKKGLCSLDKVGIKAKNDRTLVVKLNHPTPYFLQLTAYSAYFPVNHKVAESYPRWESEASEVFTSNGPFFLESWDHNREIVVKRNPKYWDAKEVSLAEIHISMINNETTALNLYAIGELDMLTTSISPLPMDSLASLYDKGLLKVSPMGGTSCCFFNTQKYPFNNKNLRKAFTYAINRKAIVKNITQLGEPIATEAVPPVLNHFKKGSYFKDADTGKARDYFHKALTELRIEASDLEGITYYYKNTEIEEKIAQALQQQWKKAFDIFVAIEPLDLKIMTNKIVQRDFVFAQLVWFTQYNDPMNVFERFKWRDNPKNFSNWENKPYIALLDQSALDETPEARAKTLSQAEAILMDEMPFAPIYHLHFSTLANPNVENLHLTVFGNVLFRKISIAETQ